VKDGMGRGTGGGKMLLVFATPFWGGFCAGRLRTKKNL